jgi:hypothetical protein
MNAPKFDLEIVEPGIEALSVALAALGEEVSTMAAMRAKGRLKNKTATVLRLSEDIACLARAADVLARYAQKPKEAQE